MSSRCIRVMARYGHLPIWRSERNFAACPGFKMYQFSTTLSSLRNCTYTLGTELVWIRQCSCRGVTRSANARFFRKWVAIYGELGKKPGTLSRLNQSAERSVRVVGTQATSIRLIRINLWQGLKGTGPTTPYHPLQTKKVAVVHVPERLEASYTLECESMPDLLSYSWPVSLSATLFLNGLHPTPLKA